MQNNKTTMTLPPITNKQQSILTLLYRFRFLNRTQIQTILKHKYPKRINDWLKDLNEKQYIGRIYSTKLGENNKPAIYYLNLNSIKYLRACNYPSVQLKKLYREKERSESFINKYLLLADICLGLQSRSNDNTKYAALTSSDFANPDSNYNFLSELNPDLVFAKESKGMKKYYVLEIFEPMLPLYSVRKKIKNYSDFYFSNSWEDNVNEHFPTVFFVCASTSMLIYAKRSTKKLLSEHEDIDLKFQFSTDQEARGIISEI